MNSCFKIHAERTATPDSDASYNCGSSPFLLGYERHPNYLDRAFENTCAEVKNKDLVCTKK